MSPRRARFVRAVLRAPEEAEISAPLVDRWIVAALAMPGVLPLLRPLGDGPTSLALRAWLLTGMFVALGVGFALVEWSRARLGARVLARVVLGLALTLLAGTLALNVAFGPDVTRLMVESTNYDFCGPHHGPCETPILTEDDLNLAKTSFFFETPLPPPLPRPDS